MIFPGGCLVNTTQLALAAAKAKSRLTLCSIDEFGLHYAETLRRWRANFNAALTEASQLMIDVYNTLDVLTVALFFSCIRRLCAR